MWSPTANSSPIRIRSLLGSNDLDVEEVGDRLLDVFHRDLAVLHRQQVLQGFLHDVDRDVLAVEARVGQDLAQRAFQLVAAVERVVVMLEVVGGLPWPPNLSITFRHHNQRGRQQDLRPSILGVGFSQAVLNAAAVAGSRHYHPSHVRAADA